MTAVPHAPSLFERYARVVVRRRKAFLIGYVVAVIALGAIGVQVLPALKAEGFNTPNSQSAEVTHLLQKDFQSTQPLAVKEGESFSVRLLANGEVLVRRGPPQLREDAVRVSLGHDGCRVLAPINRPRVSLPRLPTRALPVLTPTPSFTSMP